MHDAQALFISQVCPATLLDEDLGELQVPFKAGEVQRSEPFVGPLVHELRQPLAPRSVSVSVALATGIGPEAVHYLQPSSVDQEGSYVSLIVEGAHVQSVVVVRVS